MNCLTLVLQAPTTFQQSKNIQNVFRDGSLGFNAVFNVGLICKEAFITYYVVYDSVLADTPWGIV